RPVRHMADVIALLDVPGLGTEDLADFAGLDVLDRPDRAGAGAGLRAYLHHAAVVPGRLKHQPALANVVGRGFLRIDVFTGVAGEDGGRAMPMVWSSNDDGIHRAVLEQFPHVADD